MKAFPLILIIFVILSTDGAYGQGVGVVSFTSVGAPDSKKIMNNMCVFASGSAYRVALYWGAATETDDRNLVQIGSSATLLTGAGAGTYFGGGRTITTPATVNGPVLAFQVRGWTAAHGATYEEALQNAAAFVGKNAIFTLKTKDPNNALETTPNLYTAPGYQGFTIWRFGNCIPEPSTTALTILAAATFLLFRRRAK
jgi:hypothetical protein